MEAKLVMKIIAVYYVQESSPYQMYALEICDISDPRFVNYKPLKANLWNIFVEEQEKSEYPPPSSDVIFLTSDGNILAHMLDENDK